jgi:hypothetical protein
MGALIKQHLHTRLALPPQKVISVRTHYLVRVIVGHLLAAHPSHDQTKPITGFSKGIYADLRDYFLDESLPLPSYIRIYYWPYLSEDQVIIKGLGISSTNGRHGILGDLIKYFPVAYYVAYPMPDPLGLSVPWISGDGCNDMACEITLQIRLDSVPAPQWPETPGPGHYTIMAAARAIVSMPHAGRRIRNRHVEN